MQTTWSISASVTLCSDNAIWENSNKQILLSAASSTGIIPAKPIYPDRNADGVFTFFGLDKSKTYYVWVTDIFEFSCIGTTGADVLTKDHLSAQADFYTVTLEKSEGVGSTSTSVETPRFMEFQ